MLVLAIKQQKKKKWPKNATKKIFRIRIAEKKCIAFLTQGTETYFFFFFWPKYQNIQIDIQNDTDSKSSSQIHLQFMT